MVRGKSGRELTARAIDEMGTSAEGPRRRRTTASAGLEIGQARGLARDDIPAEALGLFQPGARLAAGRCATGAAAATL